MLLGDILARFDTPSFAEETVLALGDLNLRRVCARRQRPKAKRSTPSSATLYKVLGPRPAMKSGRC